MLATNFQRVFVFVPDQNQPWVPHLRRSFTAAEVGLPELLCPILATYRGPRGPVFVRGVVGREVENHKCRSRRK